MSNSLSNAAPLSEMPTATLVAAHDSASSNAEHRFPHTFSIYLDLIRFFAAISVLLQHTWDQAFPNAHVDFPGHEAVVMFFVLSGYVITYTALRPGVTLSTYLQHRIARIVPVAWAALSIGLVLALTNDTAPLGSTLTNMVFLGQSGVGRTEATYNPAYWSLNYEVWYYLIFAAWVFAGRYRLVLTALAMAIAGPKIVMLLPVWLMGVWLNRKMPTFGQGFAVTLFMATLVLGTIMWRFDVSDLLRAWLYHVCPAAWHAHHSTQVLYDLLLGVVVTAHFCAAANMRFGLGWLIHVERPIRYLAGFSFSIYAFHGPLGALYGNSPHPAVFYAGLALGIFVLAQLTERRVAFYRQLTRGLTGGAGQRRAIDPTAPARRA